MKDVTPLAGLTKLNELNLWSTRVNDVKPLAGLKELRHLNLSLTPVNDVVPLGGLTNLVSLTLYETEVRDLDPVDELPNLRFLRHSRRSGFEEAWRKEVLPFELKPLDLTDVLELPVAP